MEKANCLRIIVTFLTIGATIASEEEVRDNLLKNYNRRISPGQDTNVQMGFAIQHLDLNERIHALELHLWVQMKWMDARLKFSKADFPKLMVFAPEEVWVPDITLYNNADAGNFNHMERSSVVVNYTGLVHWVPPTSVSAKCVMDTTYWPHDIQTCVAIFGSWVYDAGWINLEPREKPFEMSSFYDNETSILTSTEFKLLDISVGRTVKKYDCCEHPYVSLQVKIKLERVSSAFHWLVQVPVVGLSLLTIAVFIFPPTSGEKITLGGFGLVADLMMICLASHQIGHAPTHIPHILKLLVTQFILTLTSILVCAHVIRVAKDPRSSGLPRFLRGPVLSFSSFILLENYSELVSHSNSKRNETAMVEAESAGSAGLVETSDAGKKEWLLFGAFLDRLFLILYILIFVINMIYFAGVL